MRKLIMIIAVLAVLLGAAALFVTKTTAGQDMLLNRAMSAQAGSNRPPAIDGMRVVVCGSASPLGNVPDRAQACIAVVTKDHFLIFDTGARSPMRLRQAQLPLTRLNGVFLTHFHSDHIAALPDVNMASWVRGRSSSLNVFGPEGVERVIGGFNAAYDLDRKYRVAHHGTDLLPVAAGPMTPVTIQPGYRVDYEGRSVVISGDTNATDSLFAAAEGADLLLHDALSRALIDPMIAAAEKANVPRMPKIMNDVLDYHADSLTLEQRAEDAGIGLLAYYHLVPAPPNSLAEDIFRRGMRDGTLLVKDLDTFDLPIGSKEIIVSSR